MTSDEERALAVRIQAGDVSARNELLLSQMESLRFLARKFKGGWIPQEDLVQEATYELLRIIHKFDPDRGRFRTFVTKRSWGLMHALLNRPTLKQQRPIQLADPISFANLSDRPSNDHITNRQQVDAWLVRLNPVERLMIDHLFGINGDELTFEMMKVKMRMGWLKADRIYNDAMAKLRSYAG